MEQHKKRYEIHFSSLVIGFLLALCLTLALGAMGSSDSTGPYRCSAAGDLSAFVIDTQTGQVWQVSRTDNTDFGTPLNRKSSRRSVTPMID
ncbi:MAG: hypothetical protein JW720_03360 [Sedimentisphaerales bacterium]|nr:hypothetical protein [Sedimentisphaerales bacterium]